VLKHPAPKEHLQHIGDITVSFAVLESSIQFFASSLIHEANIANIIMAELAFKNLRALVISLYLERHGRDDDFVTLRGYMNRAARVEEKRNQIIHSVWGAGKNANTITRVKATAKEKHGLRFQFEDVTAESLQDFANDIKALAEDIGDFNWALAEKGKEGFQK
jgi:hypothetical protein